MKAFTFNIEEYLDSLPDDIDSIDLSDRLIYYLPSLKRFYRLKSFIKTKYEHNINEKFTTFRIIRRLK